MVKSEKSNQFTAIRSMLEGKHITRMRDLERLYPTLVARSLGMNHSRYIQKLYKPEEFSIKHIVAMSEFLETDPKVIMEIILKQLAPSNKSGKKKPG